MTLIRDLPNYKLIVGDSVEREGSTAYQVINKEFGVVEAETFILPQAFEYLEQIQAALDAKMDMEAADEAEAMLVEASVPVYNH